MKTTAILLSLLFAFALGCNKKKGDDKKTEDPATAGKTTGTEPETPETPTAAADAAPAAAGEIPTEQDFEEKAATEVSKDNVEAEVEKMEKDLASESGAAAGGDKAPAGGDKATAGGDKAPAGGENK
jgi:type IV secretory pathway VirB10-like protein